MWRSGVAQPDCFLIGATLSLLLLLLPPMPQAPDAGHLPLQLSYVSQAWAYAMKLLAIHTLPLLLFLPDCYRREMDDTYRLS